MIRDYFWLSTAQFGKLKPLLPTDTRGKPRVDDCRVISGIVHVLKSGMRWVDVPEDIYGPRKTLYNRTPLKTSLNDRASLSDHERSGIGTRTNRIQTAFVHQRGSDRGGF